jgi:thiol-disulfide isomerase/thioredoxin
MSGEGRADPPGNLGPLGLPRAPLWPRGQWSRLLGLFVLAVAATVVSFAIVSRIAHPLLPGGAPAPPIVLHAAGTGQRHDVLTERQGHPFVLEFFETTCAICQREVKPMCDIHSRHPAIAFYGVDAARENSDTVSRFAQTQAGGCTDWPLLLDPQSTVLRSYTVTVVPTIYLVDARGRVAYTGTGEAGVSGLDDALRRVTTSG